MAKTVNIKLSSSTGSSTGPTFDLYSDADSYATAFQSGVSKTTLMSVSGYTSTLVPNAATIIRVKSTGTCTTYDDYTLSTPTPTPTLAVTNTPTPTPTSTSTPTPTPTEALTGQCYLCTVPSGYDVTNYGLRIQLPGQSTQDVYFNQLLAELGPNDDAYYYICSEISPSYVYMPTHNAQTFPNEISLTGPNGGCVSHADCFAT